MYVHTLPLASESVSLHCRHLLNGECATQSYCLREGPCPLSGSPDLMMPPQAARDNNNLAASHNAL